MIKDLVGLRFGKLKVVSFSHLGNHSRAIWNCICDCGKETKVKSQRLVTGNTKSCGCGRGRTNHTPKGWSGFRDTYNKYKRSAKKRGYEFSLSEDEFKTLTQGNCSYCGKEPFQLAGKRSENGNYLYNGIDRVDNNKGYILGNVVPCCKTCNRAKDTMTQEEFLEWIRRVYEYQASY